MLPALKTAFGIHRNSKKDPETGKLYHRCHAATVRVGARWSILIWFGPLFIRLHHGRAA